MDSQITLTHLLHVDGILLDVHWFGILPVFENINYISGLDFDFGLSTFLFGTPHHVFLRHHNAYKTSCTSDQSSQPFHHYYYYRFQKTSQTRKQLIKPEKMIFYF